MIECNAQERQCDKTDDTKNIQAEEMRDIK